MCVCVCRSTEINEEDAMLALAILVVCHTRCCTRCWGLSSTPHSMWALYINTYIYSSACKRCFVLFFGVSRGRLARCHFDSCASRCYHTKTETQYNQVVRPNSFMTMATQTVSIVSTQTTPKEFSREEKATRETFLSKKSTAWTMESR